MTDYFRKKVHYNEIIATFDDILITPGYTAFEPNEVDISSKLGKFKFNIPLMSAAMDTVTEEVMAIQMALLGGLGVVHRNCSFQKQLEMCRKVKSARSFIVEEVATINVGVPVLEAKFMMETNGISGLMVIDDNDKVCGIFTKRDIPYKEDDIRFGKLKDFMTKNVISIKPGASRAQALKMLYDNRIEKLPIIDNGYLKGLITKKDLKPEFPSASLDQEGRLLCALGLSAKFPTTTEAQSILKELDKYVDIFFIDVADFYKKIDIENTKKLMKLLHSDFVLGNIGTYEAAEHLISKCDLNENFIGLKVGMGSGSICTTSIQTGVGAPTLFATAQVADAVKDYNPNIGIIADGGFRNPGDIPKALTVGADLIMSGHLFAGCTESPGYIDTIQGRKVKVYRGMGSKEARAAGFVSDRYIEGSKTLAEGVSSYIPYVGDVDGVIQSLKEGLVNGMIYSGAKTISEMKKANIGLITPFGQQETKTHDLI